MAKISVIGAGYLGLTHAICMAELGHEVIALDSDSKKIEHLKRGEIPFHEPGLNELLNIVMQRNLIKFTTEYEEIADFACIHFICVGTPQQKNSNAADLTQLKSAINELAKNLKKPSVIVGKSTVPVGTAEILEKILQKNSSVGESIRLVWNPEFLREGHAIQDTLMPDRIVLGCRSEKDIESILDVYSGIINRNVPVLTMDFATAELIKVAANAFLATKISFINAFARLSEKVGADITLLSDALGMDERIGRKFLNSGIGFGGGCLPKDLRALIHRAEQFGLEEEFAFLRNIDLINNLRRIEVVELVKSNYPNLEELKIAILGAAFKPNSDDIRDSPALFIAMELSKLGSKISIFDPRANDKVSKLDLNLKVSNTLQECVTNSDLIIHLTEWDEFINLDPNLVSHLVKSKRIIDGRNVLDKEKWSKAGWKINFLGKPGS